MHWYQVKTGSSKSTRQYFRNNSSCCVNFVLQTHSDDKSKSDKGRKAAKPMKIIEEDDEDAFKGGSSDKVGEYRFTIKYHCVEGQGQVIAQHIFCQLHQSPLLRPFVVAPAVESGYNCMFQRWICQARPTHSLRLMSSFAVCPPGHTFTRSRCSYFRALFHEIKPFCTHGECVSLSLKEQTDSDPEPSSVRRLVAGTVTGFKWESSVGYIHSLLLHFYGICTCALFQVSVRRTHRLIWVQLQLGLFIAAAPLVSFTVLFVLHCIVAPLTMSLSLVVDQTTVRSVSLFGEQFPI